MGKLTIKQKICILITAVFLGIAGLCAVIIVANERNSDNEMYNKVRVLLNDDIHKADNLDFSKVKKYTYSIIDLSGKVIYSNDPKMLVGETADLKALSGTSKGDITSDYIEYSAPFIRNNVQEGTIYVSVPYSKVANRHVLTYITAGAIVLFILLCMYALIKLILEDILKPIREIHKVTNSIREGNLEERVYYDYDGEIGTLCHDFEALRSDLKYSTENEKKLKEKEKLLMAYISHDLRTPIAIISGYVEGIHNDIVKGEKVHEYTAIILSKIKMLNSLIDDIIEHSKAQLHEFKIDKTECYANEFFENIMKEAKQDIEKKGLSFSCSDVPNVLINIDKKRVVQVLQNLIGNSMKFTDKGEISIDFRINKNELLITVKDTGIGIAAIDIPMIFDAFYRGEKARTLNVPGSGLGLSISKYIVEQHGGRIECDSVIGKGTAIQFSLPL